MFNDVSRMGFKIHKKMATRTKREKVERERGRENGLKVGKLVLYLSGIKKLGHWRKKERKSHK